jgi:hypothetical protein
VAASPPEVPSPSAADRLVGAHGRSTFGTAARSAVARSGVIAAGSTSAVQRTVVAAGRSTSASSSTRNGAAAAVDRSRRDDRLAEPRRLGRIERLPGADHEESPRPVAVLQVR